MTTHVTGLLHPKEKGQKDKQYHSPKKKDNMTNNTTAQRKRTKTSLFRIRLIYLSGVVQNQANIFEWSDMCVSGLFLSVR